MQSNYEWLEGSHSSVFDCLLISLDALTSHTGKFLHPSTSLVVLFWVYGPYLTPVGCLLSSLKGPRLTRHFQVLKDISDACARWHWMFFPVGWTPAGCLKKVSHSDSCLCWRDEKDICLLSMHKVHSVLLKMNSPILGEPSGAWFVWKSPCLAIPIPTHLWAPS